MKNTYKFIISIILSSIILLLMILDLIIKKTIISYIFIPVIALFIITYYILLSIYYLKRSKTLERITSSFNYAVITLFIVYLSLHLNNIVTYILLLIVIPINIIGVISSSIDKFSLYRSILDIINLIIVLFICHILLNNPYTFLLLDINLILYYTLNKYRYINKYNWTYILYIPVYLLINYLIYLI